MSRKSVRLRLQNPLARYADPHGPHMQSTQDVSGMADLGRMLQDDESCQHIGATCVLRVALNLVPSLVIAARIRQLALHTCRLRFCFIRKAYLVIKVHALTSSAADRTVLHAQEDMGGTQPVESMGAGCWTAIGTPAHSPARALPPAAGQPASNGGDGPVPAPLGLGFSGFTIPCAKARKCLGQPDLGKVFEAGRPADANRQGCEGCPRSSFSPPGVAGRVARLPR
jgi:hypothetical protein